MDIEKLQKGQAILELINKTTVALNVLKKVKPQPLDNGITHGDGLYWFMISEYKDGSGWQADLSRPDGNVELLKVIIAELERQGKQYQEEFEKL